MTIIIPLAGYGTRLRPFTYETPKPLLWVAGDTVLGWIFKSISSLPISTIVLVIGYKGEEIMEWVNVNYPELNIRWVMQKDSKGLGHAIWLAGKDVPRNEDVLIYLGDTVFDVDWQEISSKDKNLIGVKEVSNPRRFGVAKVEDGEITDVVEKPENPSSNLAIVGLYYIKEWNSLFPYLDTTIQKDIKTKGEYQLTDSYRMILEEKDVILEPLYVKGWFDCGTKMSLLETNAHLLENFQENRIEADWINNPCYINNSARIKDSIIGPNVSIGSGSVIENSFIENSIIWNDVNIINSYINESIIGNRAEIRNSRGVFHLAANSLIIGKEEK